MQLLLESQERRWLTVATFTSAALHAGLLLLIILAYQAKPEAPTFAEQFVTFLVPPDKVTGPEVTGERPQMGWQGGGGEGTAETSTASEEGTGPLVEAVEEETAADTTDVAPAPDPVAELLAETSVLTELEVDSVVRRHPESAAPAYPASLLAKNIEGSVFAVFVVDTAGRVDTTTFRVIRASHPDFVSAVRAVLPRMRFRPALLSGSPVSQLVQQPFSFRIRNSDTPVQSVDRRRPPLELWK